MVCGVLLTPNSYKLKKLTAKREIILSAGAVSSPVILMHSGIGPKSLLDSLNIETLVDNPSVGQNLTDHVGVSSTWSVNSNQTLDNFWRSETLQEQLLEQWRVNKTGLLTVTSENHAAFLRIPENSSFWQEFDGLDPASGKNTAHFEFLFQVRTLRCSCFHILNMFLERSLVENR